MRSTSARNRISAIAIAIALGMPLVSCKEEMADPQPPTISITNTTDLPPVYTPEQCAALVAQFPGWENVSPVPEYDAQGRPTLWNAIVPVRTAEEFDALGEVGIYADTMPIFTDPATEAKWAGQTGSITDSACGDSALAFALVPGPVFNAIKAVTLDRGEVFFKAIIIQPVPDGVADTSITYQAMHPASYEALRDAGFQYTIRISSAQASAAAATGDAVAPAVANGEELVAYGLSDFVSDVVNAFHDAPATVEGWFGDADCAINDCVTLSVHLDLRNTDTAFGGPIDFPIGSGTDTSSPMLRAWGAHAGSQMQLPGVKVVATQNWHGIGLRHDASTDRSSTAVLSVGKGRSTGICLRTENGAGQIRTATWTKEICSFESAATQSARTSQGVVTSAAARSFDADAGITVKLQNKYFNMLAQFTDGQAYLQDVVGYTPRQVKVLTGPAANVLNPLLKGRAVTPCLAFPNSALSGLHYLVSEATTLAGPIVGPIIDVAVAYVEAVYEVDMWMPDGGAFATNRTLEDRTVPSHEYGHFAMCSLLYDEDRTKEVEIPSLLIQRISEGTYMDVGDETTRIMEAFADYFAGQTANGYNYLSLENQSWGGRGVKYCSGDSAACWDLNYVEDTNATPDPNNSTQALGTPNQMRRVATTLLDAFDGHPAGGNNPGSGDFWSWTAARGRFEPAARHAGDAHDEPIALPGPALRTLIHNWTHASWLPVAWAVNEQQFFGALNVTIRNTPKDPANPASKYTWCDVCQMFAPHDGRSCATVAGTPTGGECMKAGALVSTSMSTPEMVAICAQDPIRGFIGAPAAATDPTSTCTFTGCPARSILVGTPGDPTAACVACGPHQISVGTQTCTDCAATNVGGSTCVDCGANQIVGGADGNACVSCPDHQVPNAAKTACVACQNRQVAIGGSCFTCPAGSVAAPGETCQACPDGEVPFYGNACIPISECVCGADYCRALDASGQLCVDHVG